MPCPFSELNDLSFGLLRPPPIIMERDLVEPARVAVCALVDTEAAEDVLGLAPREYMLLAPAPAPV